MRDIVFGIVFFIPLYRNYRLYLRSVRVNAQMIYNRRMKTRHIDWAREYLVRQYLEKYYIGFWQWLKKARYGSGY